MDLHSLAAIAIQQIKTAAVNNQFLTGGFVLGALGVIVASLRRLPGRIWDWGMRTFTVYVDVTSTDDTYNWICLWLNVQPYVDRARRLSIKYVKGRAAIVPSKGNHFFLWHKRPVWIHWADEDGKMGSSEMYSAMMRTREKISIRIAGRKRQLVNDLLKEAKALLREETTNKIAVLRRQEYSWIKEWRDPRMLDTIFLPEHANDLKSEIQIFLGRRDWYQRVGVPYRRGYLFYGPPGNGKSSAAFGLASELNLPLYVLNLGTMGSDGGLETAIFELDTSKPLILLIEDIDTAIPAREHDKQKKNFSLGTLLNVLDGVTARENLVLIVTTNNHKKLDRALLRPGRIDRLVHFDNASKAQIQSAINLFFPKGNPKADRLLALSDTVSVSKIQEHLLEMSA